MAPTRSEELQQSGVEAAARYLEKREYEIIAKNWTCNAGTIDIIAKDAEGTLVFADVVTRDGFTKGFPSENNTNAKRERFETLAVAYLKDYPTTDIGIRFDIISLLVLDGNRAFIRHHINAFSVEQCA